MYCPSISLSYHAEMCRMEEARVGHAEKVRDRGHRLARLATHACSLCIYGRTSLLTNTVSNLDCSCDRAYKQETCLVGEDQTTQQRHG